MVSCPLQEDKMISQWCNKWQKTAILLHSYTWHKFLRCRKFEIYFSFPWMVMAGKTTHKSYLTMGLHPRGWQCQMLIFFSPIRINQNTWQCGHWRSWGPASCQQYCHTKSVQHLVNTGSLKYSRITAQQNYMRQGKTTNSLIQILPNDGNSFLCYVENPSTCKWQYMYHMLWQAAAHKTCTNPSKYSLITPSDYTTQLDLWRRKIWHIPPSVSHYTCCPQHLARKQLTSWGLQFHGRCARWICS